MDDLVSQITIVDEPSGDEPLPFRKPDLRQGRFQVWGNPENTSVIVLCSQKALCAVERHAEKHSSVEVGGILLGQASRYEDVVYIEIVEAISATGSSAQRRSRDSIDFSPETWAELNLIADKYHSDLRTVGWYHSHPGHGIFLSAQDKEIQDHWFNCVWQTAMVYDPLKHQGGFFVREGVRSVEAPGFYELFAKDNQRSLVTWRNVSPPDPAPAPALPHASSPAPAPGTPAAEPVQEQQGKVSVGLVIAVAAAALLAALLMIGYVELRVRSTSNALRTELGANQLSAVETAQAADASAGREATSARREVPEIESGYEAEIEQMRSQIQNQAKKQEELEALLHHQEAEIEALRNSQTGTNTGTERAPKLKATPTVVLPPKSGP